MLFGGGARPGLWSDAIVQLASLPLLAWALLRLTPERASGSAKWALIILSAIFLVPLIQLIPWPPALWTALPARGTIAAGYHAAGMALPWLPISLDPAATKRSLLSLLPATAVFLAMLSLDRPSRRALIAVVLGVAFLSTCIGFLQIMGGQGLYFYAITNPGMAVGFFANGNHNAAFLACAVVFAAAWLIELYFGRTPNRVAVALLAALVVGLVIGLAIVGSRAGLGLGLVGGLSCIALAYRNAGESHGRVLRIGAAAFLIVGVIAVQFFASGWAKRGVQERDPLQDLRWPVAVVTLQAGLKYLPFGSGIATFVPVYESLVPRNQVIEYYVNHAHDDWLELLLEGGLPALACLAGFFAWFGTASLRAWRASSRTGLDVNFARAGSVAVILFMVHSTVDYPLRSTAIMTVLALSCGFLIAVPEKEISPQGVAASQ